MSILLPQEPDDPRAVARSIDADGNIVFGRVGIQELDSSPRFGASVTSSTENTISIGLKYFTLDIDTGKHRVGDDVLIYAPDPDCFMWGEIVGKDTVAAPARILVYVDDISDLIGTFSEWEIQVVARPKPGIEKDTSTSSVDPTGAGPFTFPVTAGKFWPLGGTLLIKPTTDRTIALIGEVSAYSGTSLVVKKRATNATVSQAYSSWSIALLDAPPAKLPYNYVTGLFVTTDYNANTITVSAGSVMNYYGDVLLTLESSTTKNMGQTFSAGAGGGAAALVALTGTVSSSGANVTGSSTLFEGELIDGTGGIYMTDYYASGGRNEVKSCVATKSGSILAEGFEVSSIASNTSAVLSDSPGPAWSGATVYRGPGSGLLSSSAFSMFVVLIQKESDGTIDFCLSSSTLTGEPDIPSGYSVTNYRIIDVLTLIPSVAWESERHLYAYVYPFLPQPNDPFNLFIASSF